MFKKTLVGGVVALSLAVPLFAFAESIDTSSLTAIVNACLSPLAGADSATTEAACTTLIQTLIALVAQLAQTHTPSSSSATIDQGSLTENAGIFSLTGTATGQAAVDNVMVYLAPTNYTSYASASDFNTLINQLGKDGFYQQISSSIDHQSSQWHARFYVTNPGTYLALVYDINTHAYLTQGTLTVTNGTSSLPSGALTVSLDPSSLSYRLEAAGATQVMLGVFKFHASGEALTLQKVSVAMSDSAATPADLIQEYIYDGNTLVGTAIPLAMNHAAQRYYAVSTLSSPVTIPANGDKVLTVRGDIAQIGVSQPAHAGDLISVAIDGANATGQNSGTTIAGTFGAQYAATTQFSAGTRIYKTYPIVNLLTDTSSLTGSIGKEPILLRFSVTASPAGSVGIANTNARVSWSGVQFSGMKTYAYTDSAFSQPITYGNNGQIAIIDTTGTGSSGSQVIDIAGAASRPLEIPAGQTYYFQILGDVTNVIGNASASATLVPDTNYDNIFNLSNDFAGNFVWSPNDLGTSQSSDTDWTNGYMVTGFGNISQTITGSGTVSPTPPVVSVSVPNGTYTVGNTVTVSWSNSGTTYPHDWITTVPANQTWTSATWAAAHPASPWIYTNGSANGSATLTLPSTNGMYQLVYYQNDGFTEVARSGYIGVNPASATDSGNGVVISFTGPSASVPLGSSTVLSWQTNNAASCNLLVANNPSQNYLDAYNSSAYQTQMPNVSGNQFTVSPTAPDTLYILRCQSASTNLIGVKAVHVYTTAPVAAKRIFLTSGASWTVPTDWNSANNTIEVIGGGGGGGTNGRRGGGGGGYSAVTNASLLPGSSVSYAVGVGGAVNGGSAGDTYLCNSTSNCAGITGTSVVIGAKGGTGGAATNEGGGGVGGAAASGVGTTKFSGANAGNDSELCDYGGGSGGGGAAGPHGAGLAGQASGNPSGGNGGFGDNGFTGSFGGGSAASGGNGNAGGDWDTSHGSGGGGGGAGCGQSSGFNGGAGGMYGGGGGGGGHTGAGGSGGAGLIVISYTPGGNVGGASTENTAQLANALTALESALQALIAVLGH